MLVEKVCFLGVVVVFVSVCVGSAGGPGRGEHVETKQSHLQWHCHQQMLLDLRLPER